ncbi:MAG TPA: acetyltransferase [Williamwhitmania sp.]|nr:acetyltransferase [Williamwhitmania sp.]
MKNIIILGTGAVAAELTSYIDDNNSKVELDKQTNIVGYIEYAYNIEKYYARYNLKAPVLCDIDSFVPDENVEVLVGISDIPFRNTMINRLLEKGAVLASFIHSSVIMPASTKIGKGNIIYPFCIIGPNTAIGDFNFITSYSFISHDCTVGNGNFLSTAGIAGRVKVGDNNFFGIRATVIPHIEIGNNNTIQAGMVVDKHIGDNSTIFYRYKEQVIAIPKVD